MTKFKYIVILCLCAFQTSAQFNLEFHAGRGSYSNSELKKYQASLVDRFLVGGKVLESFPAFWYYGVDAKWNLPNSQVGFSVSQGSTGGQVYYADYSGTFREQQLLKYKTFRMLTAARFAFNEGSTSIQIDPRFGLAFATLQINRSISATDGTQPFEFKENSSFKAVNPFFEPTFSLSHSFGPIGINIFVGYQLDLASNIYRESTGRPFIFNGTGLPMNLSGLRTGGSIGFYLGRAKEIDFTPVYIGIGTGLDFGGIGLNVMSMVTEHLGLFGAVGYNLANIGLNGGVRLYASDQSAKWRPYFSAMYGYNAVYIIRDASTFNRTFYGTTIGMGVDLKNSRTNFWTFALKVPFRSEDALEYKNYLEDSNIEINRDFLPFTISLGYRIAIVN